MLEGLAVTVTVLNLLLFRVGGGEGDRIYCFEGPETGPSLPSG
jgi:hypothetical protein